MAELVDAALDGYNITIFAFGQTGSGKTHTIIGPALGQLRDGYETSGVDGDGATAQHSEQDGMLTRCLDYAFR